jgi:UDP-N-acetylmuramoyl-L-alanyl-D-glutamate--2,6-diaminopimelate ligase
MILAQVMQDIAYQYDAPPGHAKQDSANNSLPQSNVIGISTDTRSLKQGELFFALDGRHLRGSVFAKEALAKGAVAVVIHDDPAARDLGDAGNLASSGLVLRVPEVSEALAWASANFYGHPEREMMLTGVTGTNGKTTTACFIHQILSDHKGPSGLLGTIDNMIGDQKVPSLFTTPPAPELHAALRKMVDAGNVCAVMEVSSHGLAQNRVFGIEFNTGVLTNITHEHLDFHQNLENYREAKSLLFRHSQISVLNADDASYGYLKAVAKGPVITYGLSPGDVNFRGEYLGQEGRKGYFNLYVGDRCLPVCMNFIGRYNVSNALAAIAATYVQGIEPEKAVTSLEKVAPISGRMQHVDLGQPFLAIVDYAHTPDGLLQVLATLREAIKQGRIISVFGARGERDRLKRPIMGRVAGKGADYVILTTDCPYGENPLTINESVAKGIEEVGGNYRIIPDRAEAILEACKMALPGDAVIVTGRGHETVQHLENGDRFLDDRECLAQALNTLRDSTE